MNLVQQVWRRFLRMVENTVAIAYVLLCRIIAIDRLTVVNIFRASLIGLLFTSRPRIVEPVLQLTKS
jgi:hypothetical protein